MLLNGPAARAAADSEVLRKDQDFINLNDSTRGDFVSTDYWRVVT